MTGSALRFASASRGSIPAFAWARISSAATLASSGVMRSVLADGEPAQLAAHAGLEDVVLPARLPDADAEAGELAVPVDGIGAVGLEGLDGAPGEFRNAVCHGQKSLTPEGRSSKLANYWQTLWINSQLTSGGACV